jgi:hypothetical protein
MGTRGSRRSLPIGSTVAPCTPVVSSLQNKSLIFFDFLIVFFIYLPNQIARDEQRIAFAGTLGPGQGTSGLALSCPLVSHQRYRFIFIYLFIYLFLFEIHEFNMGMMY